jgi:hypothetical protein
MKLVGQGSTGTSLGYVGHFTCDQAGRHGYTVRVIPAHPDLATPVELNCVSWA